MLDDTDFKTVVKAYETEGSLNKISRNLLSRTILKKEKDRQFDQVYREQRVTYLHSFRVTKNQFQNWATQISELFLGENPRVYYRPHVSVNGKKIPPGGILYEHWDYLKRRLRSKGLLSPARPPLNAVAVPRPLLENANEAVHWLQSHDGPPDEVKENWTISYAARQQRLAEGCTVHQYYTEFPCLKVALGAGLLQADFDTLHPNRANELFDRWETIRPHIATSLQQCNYLSDNDQLLLTNLPQLLIHNRDAVIIYLLPYLIRPASNNRQLQGGGRLTHEERKESFIIHVQTAAEIIPALQRQRAALQAAGLSMQPMPVIVGQVDNLQATYVYVHDSLDNPTIYAVDSIVHAIDLSFKIFFALHCRYPARAHAVWLFLQKGLYNIHTSHDYPCPRSVEVLLGQIEMWMAEAQ
ncbi:uncharacterized protein [Fopius arisanus]|uniref:Uncharacterized protein n=1 Tax=Fopius arisanus TaxID=64838 RepID=A0A9R1TKI7_9HYME|nr:PREDICTED: uncharacterized protein LOC105271411 [Fopius arisanus]